jgi:hypothetical protein
MLFDVRVDAAIGAIRWSQCGRAIVSAMERAGSVCVFDVRRDVGRSEQSMRTLSERDGSVRSNGVLDVAFDGDARSGVAASFRDGSMRLWDLRRARDEPHTVLNARDRFGAARSLLLPGDGGVPFAFVGGDGGVCAWDMRKPTRRLLDVHDVRELIARSLGVAAARMPPPSGFSVAALCADPSGRDGVLAFQLANRSVGTLDLRNACVPSAVSDAQCWRAADERAHEATRSAELVERAQRQRGGALASRYSLDVTPSLDAAGASLHVAASSSGAHIKLVDFEHALASTSQLAGARVRTVALPSVVTALAAHSDESLVCIALANRTLAFVAR